MMLSEDRKILKQRVQRSRQTRLAELPTGAVDPRVGIFLSSLNIDPFSHAIKKTVLSFLVAHKEMPEQNGEK